MELNIAGDDSGSPELPKLHLPLSTLLCGVTCLDDTVAIERDLVTSNRHCKESHTMHPKV